MRHALFEKFSVENFGIDTSIFLAETAPSFDRLEWDLFDVRKKQIALLQEMDPDFGEKMKNESRRFYRGEIDVNQLLEANEDNILQERQKKLLAIKPHRKRGMSVFQVDVKEAHSEPIIMPAPQKPYTQPDIGNYERSEPRRYPKCPDEMLRNIAITILVQEFSRKLKGIHPHITGIEVQLHPTRVVCAPDETSRPTLEGIHNDGADYIVSALVIARENVIGAESIVYDSDASTVLFRETLKPGEGIFQDDARLFHEATPLQRANPASESYRDMIGFDFHLQYGS